LHGPFSRDSIPEMTELTIVGGANVDIQGFPHARFLPGDSNPGTVRINAGGVGRNVAEASARLGLSVRFLSVFSNNPFSRIIIDSLHDLAIDTVGSLIAPEGNPPMYLCVLDESGKLVAAVSDMEIVERLTPDWADSVLDIVRGSQVCVLDANLPQETIRRFATLASETRILFDPVSVTKAFRGKDSVGHFYAIKPNVEEAEALSGMRIKTDSDLGRAAAHFHAQGTKLVFISLGRRGLFFSDGEMQRIALSPRVHVANVSGAGDAATAGIAYGIVKGLAADQTARLAVSTAALTVQSVFPIDPDLGPARAEALAREVVIDE
jgi:pseudouridine kinase